MLVALLHVNWERCRVGWSKETQRLVGGRINAITSAIEIGFRVAVLGQS